MTAMEDYTFHPVAHIRSDFQTKFGIPRQSGLAQSLLATVVFAPDYRAPEALRGIEGFSHLWLLWGFSASKGWSPTVRPPRLGGNTRVGVFASRSPFRPNPIGLSCVRLERVEQTADVGTVLIVSGADLMDGTPIFDIKPYLPYADCQPEEIETLKEMIRAAIPCKDISVGYIGPIIGASIGPDAFGIWAFGKSVTFAAEGK